MAQWRTPVLDVSSLCNQQVIKLCLTKLRVFFTNAADIAHLTHLLQYNIVKAMQLEKKVSSNESFFSFNLCYYHTGLEILNKHVKGLSIQKKLFSLYSLPHGRV